MKVPPVVSLTKEQFKAYQQELMNGRVPKVKNKRSYHQCSEDFIMDYEKLWKGLNKELLSFAAYNANKMKKL